jgi:uncharacterized protein YuzE
MEAAIRILDHPEHLDWEYDEEADVLYLSVGGPIAAEGRDLGDGIVVRYDEARNEVVGVTKIGLRDRVLRELRKRAED